MRLGVKKDATVAESEVTGGRLSVDVKVHDGLQFSNEISVDVRFQIGDAPAISGVGQPSGTLTENAGST